MYPTQYPRADGTAHFLQKFLGVTAPGTQAQAQARWSSKKQQGL